MNIHLLLLAFLLFTSSRGSEARAIDDIDNSIEARSSSVSSNSSPRTRFGQDWIKFTKTPPVKILQSLGSPVKGLGHGKN